MRITAFTDLLSFAAGALGMEVAGTDMTDLTGMTGTGEALALTGAGAVPQCTDAEALALIGAGATVLTDQP